jgi:hypothetical protein
LRYIKKLVSQKLLDFFGLAVATPFPGLSLWNTVQKFHLIPEEIIRNYRKMASLQARPIDDGIAKRYSGRVEQNKK